MVKITQDEWLDGLTNAQREVDGFTRRDVEKQTGLSRSAASERISDAIQRGDVRFVGTRMESSITGIMHPVPVYRAVPKAQRGKRPRR